MKQRVSMTIKPVRVDVSVNLKRYVNFLANASRQLEVLECDVKDDTLTVLFYGDPVDIFVLHKHVMTGFPDLEVALNQYSE